MFAHADFVFEAIKSEREGTPRFYLEAAEAFALSPVEFFHADNFSVKFAAPVLLGAFRDGGGDDDAGAHIDSEDRVGRELYRRFTKGGELFTCLVGRP